jgi:hypothetical protein
MEPQDVGTLGKKKERGRPSMGKRTDNYTKENGKGKEKVYWF